MNPSARPPIAGATAVPLAAPVALAGYQALCLNAPELAERLASMQPGGADAAAWVTVAAEAGMVLGVCLLLTVLLASLGRRALLYGGAAMVLLSASASYYMVRYDVVIGYGIVQAVMASDQALSREKLGHELALWVLALGVVPVIVWWRCFFKRRDAASTPRRIWLGRAAVLAGALGLTLASQAAVRYQAERQPEGRPAVSVTGMVAHRYVPTNWLSGMGMTVANRTTVAIRAGRLDDPAQRFSYQERAPLDDVTVVLVVGETTRHDHMGLLGYARDTTPRLSQEANLVAFRAESCDTSTRLSLACMFVRPEGVVAGDGFQPDRINEEMVFSVFRKLGFSIELFAMQSEVGFYHRVGPDFYKMREIIAAGSADMGRPINDELLLPEVEASLQRHPRGRHLIVLHKKGSHFLYSQRYPRQFARWTPECLDADDGCSAQQLVNAYDNSVLYGDHVLAELLERLRHRKALVVFTSDHGESIGDGTHFHGTPRAIAPPEQRRTPLVFWASPTLLDDPVHRAAFARLRERAANGTPARHQHLFASLLGCLSVSSSDGGITPGYNLCH